MSTKVSNIIKLYLNIILMHTLCMLYKDSMIELFSDMFPLRNLSQHIHIHVEIRMLASPMKRQQQQVSVILHTICQSKRKLEG